MAGQADIGTRTAAGTACAACAAGAAGALLVLALAAWTASPAWAHTELVDTAPIDASTVDRVPAAVVLTFTEPAVGLGTQVLVSGPAGAAQDGAPHLDGGTVTQALLAGSPAGTYTVSWRVTSTDGHPISGAFTFIAVAGSGASVSSTVTPGAGGATATPSPVSTPVGTPPGPGGSARPQLPTWQWVVAASVALLAIGVMSWRRWRRPS